jgi:hypothetical protein
MNEEPLCMQVIAPFQEWNWGSSDMEYYIHMSSEEHHKESGCGLD